MKQVQSQPETEVVSATSAAPPTSSGDTRRERCRLTPSLYKDREELVEGREAR